MRSPTMLLRTKPTPKSSSAAVTFSEFVSTRVGPSISEPTAMIAPVRGGWRESTTVILADNRRQIFLLPGQRFPLPDEQVDHGLQIGVPGLNFLHALPVAVHVLAAEEQVVALALLLRGSDPLLERGDLLVDFSDAPVAFFMIGRGLRLRRDQCG